MKRKTIYAVIAIAVVAILAAGFQIIPKPLAFDFESNPIDAVITTYATDPADPYNRTVYRPNQAQIDELKSRLTSLSGAKKTRESNYATTMASIEIHLENGGSVNFQSKSDGTLQLIWHQLKTRTYYIENEEFHRYVINLCSGGDSAPAVPDEATLEEDSLTDQSLDKTLEQALQEYAMQVIPGDGFYFGWKQLAEEESGEKRTAYGILLFHSESGSPLIFSEETGRYCSAIYSTYLLPVSVSYENDTNGSCVIIDCWMPSEENYEQDILAHFPTETAGLVLENLDQYITEILKDNEIESVREFFPGGPIWPEYSFDEELDNTELCGLAGYYPVGDIYYEPVHNELIRRFKDDPVGLLNGLSLCNEETQSAVRNLIAAEVGASKLEAGLLALESEHEEQAPAKPANKESAKPAAPPTNEDIRAALIANHASVEELHMGVPNTSTPFQTEGWLVLAEEDDTTTHTVYLLTHHAIYDLLGSGTQTKYEAAAFCHHATALTFLWQDNRWQLSEYWLPGDGAYYEADTRATFPAEAVDKLFGNSASLYENDVIRQCDDAAVRYYAQLTNWVPAKTFYPSDVEFSGQTLYTSADTMTYEERLAWAQAGEDNGQIWPACTGQYSEGEGCIAYVEKIVAGRYPDLSLRLRFADGATSESLPLPRAGGYDTALPESMEFRDGKFIYEIVFTAEALSNEGQTLIHLEGTYHYEVDLTAKTVSLTVLQ